MDWYWNAEFKTGGVGWKFTKDDQKMAKIVVAAQTHSPLYRSRLPPSDDETLGVWSPTGSLPLGPARVL